jgi:hypothetical protein
VQIPAEAVHDAIAAVFRQSAYDRSLRETLLSRALAWLGSVVGWLREAVTGSPVAYWTAITLLALVVALVLGRLAYVAYATREASTRRAAGGGRRAAGAAREPWELAQELSAAGRYTEAAHALYRALLEWLAARERLRLHPSKTAGDYARELRARSSGAFARFRDFARAYDLVVYGLGECDRERYERLHALATSVTSPAAGHG